MTPTPPDFQAMAREMIEEDKEYGHSDDSLAGLIATALEDAYRTGRQSGIGIEESRNRCAEVLHAFGITSEQIRALGREK